MGKTFM